MIHLLPKHNYKISSSSGTFAYQTDGTVVDITNFSLSFTTTGRNVGITIFPDGDSSGSEIEFSSAGLNRTSFGAWIYAKRDSTTIGKSFFGHSLTVPGQTNFPVCQISVPVSTIFFVDELVSPGTYTYKLQAQSQSMAPDWTRIRVTRGKMFIFEF